MKRFSYNNAGVDIEKGAAFVQVIKPSRYELIATWLIVNSVERRSRLS